jgi:hypothetical protein
MEQQPPLHAVLIRQALAKNINYQTEQITEGHNITDKLVSTLPWTLTHLYHSGSPSLRTRLSFKTTPNSLNHQRLAISLTHHPSKPSS